MPEYLAPGVYIEETSFRSKSIEGVSTSTAGFIGPARFGPVSGTPELITSLADFQRIYGGMEDLTFGGTSYPNYLAHGVRAFFEEGGRRLYVQRVFNFGSGYSEDSNSVPSAHYSKVDVDVPASGGGPSTTNIVLVARFPGVAGDMRVTVSPNIGSNVLSGGSLSRVRDGDIVMVAVRGGGDATNDGLYVARNDGSGWVLSVDDTDSNDVALSALTNHDVQPVSLLIEIERPTTGGTGFAPPDLLGEYNTQGVLSTFVRNPKKRYAALTTPFAIERAGELGATANASDLTLLRTLLGLADDAVPTASTEGVHTLTGGGDGSLPDSTTYEGIGSGYGDFENLPLQEALNGLVALEGVDDISILAAPGHSDYGDADAAFAIQGMLVSHCETMRYRVAVLDTPKDLLVTSALSYRNRRSSDYAAMYYPWVVVADPRPGQGGGQLKLPPSGFVAGIYARNDVENAVFKAPANEVVRLALDFEQRLSKAHQEVLNPQGVNCFRFFEGRGNLLWGARTVSDDPEWKYLNVRRYFAYLEYSIEQGTQWAVFENNSRQLWDNVRRTIEDFLYNEWRSGGLLGDKPEEAYFVRCDRTTMTQNDLDNGRLVCLIGVAPVKPAEFVIFRIGQWTADA